MKYKQQKQIKKYKALGFVEALISIMIAGMASVVLMGVAVDTISQITKNEVADEMTQSAIEMGAQIKAIANRNNNEVALTFPRIAQSVNSCFAVVGNKSQPEFATDEEGNFVSICNYEAGERNSCKDATLLTNEELFGVFCMTSASDSSSGLVVGKVIIGRNICLSSSDCDIPDYSYFVLTKTLQK